MSVLNSFQLRSTPFESEVLLPICYQNLEDILCRCFGVFYLDYIWLVRRLFRHQYINESNYFMYQSTATDSPYLTNSSSSANSCISIWEILIAKYNGKSVHSGLYMLISSTSEKLSKVQRLAFIALTFNRIIGIWLLDYLMV